MVLELTKGKSCNPIDIGTTDAGLDNGIAAFPSLGHGDQVFRTLQVTPTIHTETRYSQAMKSILRCSLRKASRVLEGRREGPNRFCSRSSGCSRHVVTNLTISPLKDHNPKLAGKYRIQENAPSAHKRIYKHSPPSIWHNYCYLFVDLKIVRSEQEWEIGEDEAEEGGSERYVERLLQICASFCSRFSRW